MLQDYANLPREAHVRFNDLASGKHKKGIIGLSEMTIRRLIKAPIRGNPHDVFCLRGSAGLAGTTGGGEQ